MQPHHCDNSIPSAHGVHICLWLTANVAVAGEQQVWSILSHPWICLWQRREGLGSLLHDTGSFGSSSFWEGCREVLIVGRFGRVPTKPSQGRGLQRAAHPPGKGLLLGQETQYLDLLHHVAELDQELFRFLGSV